MFTANAASSFDSINTSISISTSNPISVEIVYDNFATYASCVAIHVTPDLFVCIIAIPEPTLIILLSLKFHLIIVPFTATCDGVGSHPFVI